MNLCSGDGSVADGGGGKEKEMKEREATETLNDEKKWIREGKEEKEDYRQLRIWKTRGRKRRNGKEGTSRRKRKGRDEEEKEE